MPRKHRSSVKRSSRSSRGRSRRRLSDPSGALVHPRYRELNSSLITRKETYIFGSIAVAAAAVFNGIDFLWSSVGSATSLAAVYDQYRILRCRVDFLPVFTDIVANATGTSNPGNLHTVIDYDDAVSPANTAAMAKYSTYRTVTGVRRHRVNVKPMSAVGAYSGVVFTGFDSVYAQWHQTASPSINHYGVKYGIDDNNFAAATTIYNIEITMWYQCRAQK
jgi:hypothetical protein